MDCDTRDDGKRSDTEAYESETGSTPIVERRRYCGRTLPEDDSCGDTAVDNSSTKKNDDGAGSHSERTLEDTGQHQTTNTGPSWEQDFDQPG